MAELITAVMHGISQRAAEAGFPVLDASLNADPPRDHDGMPLPFIDIGSAPAPPARLYSSPGPWLWSGIAIITFVAPLGRPQLWYVEKAARIAALFPGDGRMNSEGFCIRFSQPGYPLSPMLDRATLRTPVRVHWQCAKR